MDELENTGEMPVEIEQTGVVEQESPTEPSNPLIQEQAEPEAVDWTTDKRAKTMWKNDPNKLYESYKNMEKLYAPVKTQHEQIQSILKEHGIESGKLKDVFSEYKTLTDPEGPQQQWLSYIGNWLNSEHKESVIKFFDDLEKQQDRKRYGENLPPEVIEKLKLSETTAKELQQIKQQAAEEQQYQQTMKSIESNLTEIEKMASEYDVEWNDATKTGFIEYCKEQGIEPKYMKMAFQALASEAIRKSASVKAERQVVDNLQKNKKAGIVTKSTGGAPVKKDGDYRSTIEKMIFGN